MTLRQLKKLVQDSPGRRLMGLDVGTTFVGIAVSDAACRLASPLSVVGRSGPFLAGSLKTVSPASSFANLRGLVASTQPLALVVGLPLEIHGSPSMMTVRTREFVRTELSGSPALRNLPYVLWDERYSSIAAAGLLSGLDLPYIEAKRISDKASAVYILQGCLDALAALDGTPSHASGSAPPSSDLPTT